MDFLQNDPVGRTKSPNGALGLWISPFPELCRPFGPHWAEVKLHKGFDPIVMPVRQLMSYHLQLKGIPSSEQVHIYAALREDLLDLGDVLFIHDATGIGEVVVLNYDAIAEFEYQTGPIPEWKDKRYPIDPRWLQSEATRKVTYLALRNPEAVSTELECPCG